MNPNLYYRYGNSRHECPCLDVTLMNPVDSQKHFVCKAIIDTGSDLTFFPIKNLQFIGAKADGPDEVVEGIGGCIRTRPFAVSMILDGMSLTDETVYGWKLEKALIGRDLINRWLIDLNGPRQSFIIHHPPY